MSNFEKVNGVESSWMRRIRYVLSDLVIWRVGRSRSEGVMG